MSKVYLLTHLRPEDHEEEDLKIIGIYSTRENAEKTRDRLLTKPGFSDHPDGFYIEAWNLDQDSWVDGFVRPGWKDED